MTRPSTERVCRWGFLLPVEPYRLLSFWVCGAGDISVNETSVARTPVCEGRGAAVRPETLLPTARAARGSHHLQQPGGSASQAPGALNESTLDPERDALIGCPTGDPAWLWGGRVPSPGRGRAHRL